MTAPETLFLDGRWRASSDGGRMPLHSPVTGSRIDELSVATTDDVDAALSSAASGFERWRDTPAWDRSAVLRRAAELIRERTDQIAASITRETGKPLAESRGEIASSADQFEWYAGEAQRINGQILPPRGADELVSVRYRPVGVVLALTAWNFPLLLPARKIAAALAAGCAVIARPASEAPGPTFELAEALRAAGLPDGVLTVLTGHAQAMTERLLASPVVRKVSFTGSVRVARRLIELSAHSIARMSMELGGHAPVIVHPDVDPGRVASQLAAAKFRNAGQVCASPSRFFVHEAIATEFTDAFAAQARAVVVGDGRDDGVTMGPLIRRRAQVAALELIDDARRSGARIVAGGERPDGLDDGNFVSATVLTGVDEHARIMREEPFAPVAPIVTFTDLDDVVRRANSVPYGLASYVFTHDAALAERTASRLDVGMVGINETALALAEAPFGGVKESGYGREGGSQGILDYVEAKYVRHRLTPRAALAAESSRTR